MRLINHYKTKLSHQRCTGEFRIDPNHHFVHRWDGEVTEGQDAVGTGTRLVFHPDEDVGEIRVANIGATTRITICGAIQSAIIIAMLVERSMVRKS